MGWWKNDDERKIIYIPQTYLNRLSDEKESKTEIDSIIEDVVLIDEKSKQKIWKCLITSRVIKGSSTIHNWIDFKSQRNNINVEF